MYHYVTCNLDLHQLSTVAAVRHTVPPPASIRILTLVSPSFQHSEFYCVPACLRGCKCVCEWQRPWHWSRKRSLKCGFQLNVENSDRTRKFQHICSRWKLQILKNLALLHTVQKIVSTYLQVKNITRVNEKGKTLPCSGTPKLTQNNKSKS
jgi:hypothetical protein